MFAAVPLTELFPVADLTFISDTAPRVVVVFPYPPVQEPRIRFKSVDDIMRAAEYIQYAPISGAIEKLEFVEQLLGVGITQLL